MKNIILIISLILFWGSHLEAQTTSTTTDHNTNAWGLYLQTVRFSPKWSFLNEVHWRRANVVKEPFQWILRPTLNYHLHQDVILSIGYSHI